MNNQTSAILTRRADTTITDIISSIDSSSVRNHQTESNKRIKAIEDIYFGIPESEHFTYFNRQISLGECNYRVKYLGYNNNSLGPETISGLYSFRLEPEKPCNDIEYLVRLFSAKYGSPNRTTTNESVGIPDLTDKKDIDKLDNNMNALMLGVHPLTSEQHQTSTVYVTDGSTKFPSDNSVSRNIYKWETDSISIELSENYFYSPVGDGNPFTYKGSKTGANYTCETVSNFVLQNKSFIDFIHRTTEVELNKYWNAKKEAEKNEVYKSDSLKL